MYPLFMVGAKLLGIYLIVNGLVQVAVLTTANRGPVGTQFAMACCLYLMSGTLLAFGTGIVARVLRVHEEFDGETPTISYSSALEVGILLIGVYELFNTLPRALARWVDFSQMIVLTRAPSDFLTFETFAVAASVLMLRFAHRIAALLERANRRPPEPPELKST
jgi:hypothetical protein